MPSIGTQVVSVRRIARGKRSRELSVFVDFFMVKRYDFVEFPTVKKSALSNFVGRELVTIEAALLDCVNYFHIISMVKWPNP